MRWPIEETVTTRPVTCSSRRLVSAKWPRWLVPNCSSKPSAVATSGGIMTPALLISRSISPSQPAANSRTEARLARSSRRTSVVPGIVAAAASALVGVADGEDDAGALRGERTGGGAPDAAVGAGDDHGAAGHVGDVCVEKVVMSNNVGADHNDVKTTSSAICLHDDRPRARPTERPYHHGNLRSALLAAAERTVRERGVQELSLRELAREVGVSHGAPRRHFPDRQALLDALAESGIRAPRRRTARRGRRRRRGLPAASARRPPRPTSASRPATPRCWS